MRRTHFTLILSCISLLTSCTSAPQLITPTAIVYDSTPTADFSLSVTSTPHPTAGPDFKAMGESLLASIPQCSGMEVLEKPIVFSWPDISTRIQELGEAQWGYYSCDLLQADASGFYKKQLTDSPFNYLETNWIDRKEGTVGVYFVSSSTWMYVWVVPQPGDPGRSFVIVALSSEAIEC
jgi:hypothetical protein